jgi:serine/threonine protein kinase
MQVRTSILTSIVKRQFIPKRRPLIWDFEFLKVIGKGGFSNVYQVRKKEDGNIYALKCLKKHLIKRQNKVRHIMNEKHILALVDHPFIVKINWAF